MRLISNQEFRQMLERAYEAGETRVSTEYYPYADGSVGPDFDEWFEKHYGDILGVGDISPEDEKTGTTLPTLEMDTIMVSYDHHVSYDIIDGAGNVLDTVRFEIPPTAADSAVD